LDNPSWLNGTVIVSIVDRSEALKDPNEKNFVFPPQLQRPFEELPMVGDIGEEEVAQEIHDEVARMYMSTDGFDGCSFLLSTSARFVSAEVTLTLICIPACNFGERAIALRLFEVLYTVFSL
jgi:hypothetical protein